jgi:ribosomal protein S27AE
MPDPSGTIFLATQCPLCGTIANVGPTVNSRESVRPRALCGNCGATYVTQDPHGYTAPKPESEGCSKEADFKAWGTEVFTVLGSADSSATLNLDTARKTMDAAYKLLATCTVVAGGGYSEKERADSANMLEARILLLEWLSGMR